MPRETVPRFGGTERAFHWVFAAGFLVLLATGAVMYLPDLATLVGRRPLVKTVHLWGAVAWVAGLVGVVAAGDRRALARTWRQAERLDHDDLRWLRRRPARPGRFNAGQKLNLMATGASGIIFVATGAMMWLGERDHRFIVPGAGVVHVVAAVGAAASLTGHLYLALVHPSTRPALRGMVTGRVDAAWARRHHPRWATPGDDPAPSHDRQSS